MYKISLSLGLCIGSILKTPLNSSISYWTVLKHYGVSDEDLKKLDLSYEELFEIYTKVKQHEHVRNFLKDLKEKLHYLQNDIILKFIPLRF